MPEGLLKDIKPISFHAPGLKEHGPVAGGTS
jgi:hypothetical protein